MIALPISVQNFSRNSIIGELDHHSGSCYDLLSVQRLTINWTNLCWFIVNHENEDIILKKFSSLAAPEVVEMTPSSAASDKNFIKMTFPFQWLDGQE